MDYKSISAGELAVILDVQRSNISHILNGRNKPGAAFIEKMLNEFPDLNARWLLTGEGDMCTKKEIQMPNIQQKLPLSPEKKAVTPEVTKEAPKELKEVTEVINKVPEVPVNETSIFPFITSEVESIILLYKDGSFSTYSNRKS